MPRLPALRIEALARLNDQLRYEPPAAARLKLARAEALAQELLEQSADPAAPQTLPESYVLFRLTGLRMDDPSPASAPSLLVREPLLGDLSALIDRLSAAAKILEAELGHQAGGAPPGPWLSTNDLLSRWSVSRKTLERFRRRGLLARRVVSRGGVERLVFRLGHVERFETLLAKAIAKAAGFSRIDDATRMAMIAQARAMLGESRVSLTACAKALARQHTRSIQAVRDVLTRSGPDGLEPPFLLRPRVEGRDRSRLESARARGVPLSVSARQLVRSRPTAYRLLNLQHADRLRDIDLAGQTGPLLDRPDAGEVLLSPPMVRMGLGERWSFPLGHTLLGPADATGPDARDELALATALAFLRRRAGNHIRALDPYAPSAAALHAATTDLLWAARLKARLALLTLPLLVRTGESIAGCPGRDLMPGTRQTLAAAGLDALLDAIDRFDPFKGGRLAAAAGVAIARAMSRLLRDQPGLLAPPASPPSPVSRAASRRPPDAPAAPDDFTRRVYVWQSALDLPPTAIDRLPTLDTDRQGIVVRRFGLQGRPPESPADIARSLGLRPARIAQLLRTAVLVLTGPEPSK